MDRSQIVAEISNQLAQAKAFARRRSLRALLNESISLTHLHVLTVLSTDGARTMSELANTLGVSFASATGIVTRMEERELALRTRSEEDRRVVMVAIAPGGLRTLEEIEGRGRKQVTKLLDTLTLDELEQLRGGLAALQRAGREFAAADVSTAEVGDTKGA